MHIDAHSDTLLLKPEKVAAGREVTQLDVVHTMLVTLVLDELGFAETILNIHVRGWVNLNKLEVCGF
jgi:hypothetical protein